MAESSGIQRSAAMANSQTVAENPDMTSEEVDCFGRPGSQIEDKIEFKNRFGENVQAVPVIVDFRRVLQLGQVNENDGVISGVSNRDLLHAVAGLYDISLTDMESETIYSTVCARWARTIVLVQDMKDAVEDMTERNIKQKNKAKKSEPQTKAEDSGPDWKARLDVNEDVIKEEESIVSSFLEVFSDTEDEEAEEEEEDDEEEENFSKGIHTFINSSMERRKLREQCSGPIQPQMIGIENRLLGCATFERKFVAHKERVIHLTLISVRPRHRKYRIGRYLLSKCVSPIVVGNHDAVVVHADNSAVDFFQKFGFKDDVILNSKWSELADAFTNCTLMSYLPGFSGHALLSTTITKEKDPDIYEIDQELKLWQDKSREAYQGQLCCVMKFRNEILQLKHLVQTQNELLNKLVSDHDQVQREKLQVEKDLLALKLQTVKASFSAATEEIPVPEEPLAAIVQPEIEKTATPFVMDSNSEIIVRFTEGMEADRSISVRYSVTSITKAPHNPSLWERYTSSLRAMQDPDMVTELYYAGSLERPNRLSQILTNGFSDEDFTHGEFGRGLYFTKYPSKAAQFSALGKMLEVRVGLGKVETVMKYDRTRKAPSSGNDCIISPGRLYRPGDQGEAAMLCQEYVLFNVDQVLPICIITYSANPST